MERQLGVTPLRQASTPPSASSYLVIYLKPYSKALDPKYVVSISVPPHLHTFFDQLCQRHLKPLAHLKPAQVHHIIGWKEPGTLFHIPAVSLSALRAVLSDTSRTNPYRDLIEHPMVSLVDDEHMTILAKFYNRLLSGCKVEILHFWDSALVAKKSPHGVVANGRPLSNLSVISKLFSMVITKALQSWLVYHDRISRTQMAMQRFTSVVDLLRVVFDRIEQRW